MKAIILNEARRLTWAEVPEPVRKADEVLIDVHAAAVNRADLMQVDGHYQSPPEWPQWCGLEVSGIVLEAPANAAVQPGDQVCALVGGGGYSSRIAVPAGMVIPIPAGISLADAAAIPEVWSTVYLNVQLEAGGLRPGDVFFVQAGASGIGLAAIQFAKLYGAQVITTVSTPDKANAARRAGADIVINYRTEDVSAVLEAHPVNVALDCIGGPALGTYLRNLAFGGRWIMIASMGGAETQINVETLWRKRLRLIGNTLRSRTAEEKSRIMHALQQELWPLFSAGKLQVNVGAHFPVAEVEKAHALLRTSASIGKVVLTF